MDYVQSRGYGIVDVNIVKRLPAVRKGAPASMRRVGGISAIGEKRLKLAVEVASLLWYRVISGATTPKKVVLIGCTTKCVFP